MVNHIMKSVIYIFNISHAGGYVVMVIDRKEVGIDIEPNLNIELDELLDIFHPREKNR